MHDKIRSVAIFGGTFDPFHNGHLQLIRSTLTLANLDHIYIMPNYIPPHKAQPMAKDQQRLEMVQLIANSEPNVSVLDFEILKRKVSYTYETVIKLYGSNEFSNCRISLIIGMDSLLSFTTWYNYRELLNIVNLIVAQRPSYDISKLDPELSSKLTKLSKFDKTKSSQIVILNNEEYDMSSSQIRKSKIENICNAVPPYIRDYILKNGLYNLKIQ